MQLNASLALMLISRQCQDEFRNLSECVLKILTAVRILQISIARCQVEAEIHSFPTMYGKAKGGVDLVKIGENKVSVQKLCRKQGFFKDTNLDQNYAVSQKKDTATIFRFDFCNE